VNRVPRVFDFGCGLGAWLDVLEEAGWDTYGLEPGAKQARVAARRHRIVASVPREESFDLVILNHVLEHLLDPLVRMRELASAIVPGQLYVSVPDLGEVHRHQRLAYVANDLHINSFTLSGLRSLLALAGLEVEEHLPGWGTATDGPPRRMRVLARKSGAVRFPVEERPLDQAIESLRELGRIESSVNSGSSTNPTNTGATKAPGTEPASPKSHRSPRTRTWFGRLLDRPRP
jgi:SAM-dependent methyltransferase